MAEDVIAAAIGAAPPPPALGLPRPPQPLALQRELFAACMTEVVIMTPVQIARFVANGVQTAEDIAMLDSETLMGIPLNTMSAMTKMRPA
jgi:hypothetical protein